MCKYSKACFCSRKEPFTNNPVDKLPANNNSFETSSHKGRHHFQPFLLVWWGFTEAMAVQFKNKCTKNWHPTCLHNVAIVHNHLWKEILQ